jgi:hypothetical protein
LITRIRFGEQYRTLRSSLCNIIHSPVTSSLLDPNIFLSTLISNNLTLRSSRNVNDQVSHPYKTKGKIVVLYILIFIFLYSKMGKNYSSPKDSKHFLTSNFSQFLHEWNFGLLMLFPIILILPHFQRNYYKSLYCDFVLYFISRHKMYLVLSALTSSPVSYPAAIKATVLSV